MPDDGQIYHHVGEVDITSSVDAVNAVVQVYRRTRTPRKYIFGYEEYLDALKRKGSIEGRLDAIDKHHEREAKRWRDYQAKYDAWASSDTGKAPPSFHDE